MQSCLKSIDINEIKKDLKVIKNISVLNLNTIDNILGVGQFREKYKIFNYLFIVLLLNNIIKKIAERDRTKVQIKLSGKKSILNHENISGY